MKLSILTEIIEIIHGILKFSKILRICDVCYKFLFKLFRKLQFGNGTEQNN